MTDFTTSLGYPEDACGVPIEYLSHFSSSGIAPTTACVFASPETYDSAIVSSVRSIQDLQRRRQRKPCTFYMEGNCRRTDCKFSHELAEITCRFWQEGNCFKGLACPFLHGYPLFDEDSGPSSAATGHESHHRPSHHHHYNNGTMKKDAVGHVAKRNNKFVIGEWNETILFHLLNFISIEEIPNKSALLKTLRPSFYYD